MPTHRVAISVEMPDIQESAVQALGDQSLDEALRGLATVALREWLEWLVADDRPASLTEVSKRRVKSLVDGGLLPKIPTAQVIAQRARLSLGQARYIVSSLALEDPSASAEARDGLTRRLRDALAEATSRTLGSSANRGSTPWRPARRISSWMFHAQKPISRPRSMRSC